MSQLELLPRKSFRLTLSDGKIVEGQFGTWALARFGEKKKVSLSQIMELFSNDVGIMDILLFVLCAIEYKERQAGVAPYMNEIRLSQFIDEYADEHNQSGVLMTLLNHSGNEEKMPEAPGEKKTEVVHGAPSNDLSMQPAEV